MVNIKRINEVYRFYVFREPSNEESSIKRFEILRERFGKILKASKLRSIQLAMGSNTSPFQDVIAKMSEEEFSEFIADDTVGSRRKEIFLKNKNKKAEKKEVYKDREFSFQLNSTEEGAAKVIKKLKEFLSNTDWAYKSVKSQLVK